MKPVVLDTSVLIAASLSPARAAGVLLDAFYDDRLVLAYTAPMLAEYMEVMERPKFAAFIDANARLSFAMKLHASGKAVTPPAVPKAAWPDPDDLPFVAAALATDRKIVITFNPHDFAPAKTFGIRVLSPRQAWTELLS